MFEFKIRATEKDPDGYFHPRWDLAQHITVKAQTKKEAIEKAAVVLGSGARWPFAFVVDQITEI